MKKWKVISQYLKLNVIFLNFNYKINFIQKCILDIKASIKTMLKKS